MKVASLAGRYRRLKTLTEQRYPPKTWVFVIESGCELPQHIRAKFGPEDAVIIREYPSGLLGDDMPEGYQLCWTK